MRQLYRALVSPRNQRAFSCLDLSPRTVLPGFAYGKEAADDAAFVAKALGTIARAKGMSQLARDTGLGRESLYKALSGEANPSFATILKVTHAMGIKLHAAPINP